MDLNPSVCPQCKLGMLRRGFTWLQFVGIVLFTVIFFPVALMVFLSPAYLYCEHCQARFE